MKTDFIKNNIFFFAAAFVYTLIFFWFYPPIFAVRDESYYLAMAEILKQGKLFIEQTDVLYWLAVPNGGHFAPRYPLGNSVILLPFLYLGWKTVFLSGLIFHLLSSWIFLKWLRSREVSNPIAPLLFLFFPVFIFYSRTIMSDIPSLFFFMLAYYFYFNPRLSKWPVGIFLGFTLLLRFSNLAYLAAFMAGVFFQCFKEKKMGVFARVSGAFLPFAVLTALSNAFYYGGPFKTGYIGAPDFGYSAFWKHLWHYLTSTSMVWPAMLPLFFLWSKTRRVEMWAVVFGGFLLCSFCLYLDDFRNAFGTRVFAVRYFFPAFPFLLLSYAERLETFWARFARLRSKIVLSAVLLILSAGSIGVHASHQAFLNEQEKMRRLIYSSTEEGSVILFDGNVYELVQTIFGNRVYAQYDWTEDIQKALAANPGKNAYLVTRHDSYRGTAFWSYKPGEREKTEARFRLEEIASEGGLRIERVSADK